MLTQSNKERCTCLWPELILNETGLFSCADSQFDSVANLNAPSLCIWSADLFITSARTQIQTPFSRFLPSGTNWASLKLHDRLHYGSGLIVFVQTFVPESLFGGWVERR